LSFCESSRNGQGFSAEVSMAVAGSVDGLAGASSWPPVGGPGFWFT
jgi:hypothetical protein